MKTKKGFTLIELLVVVAIIGLLASIVLGSLNISRDRAANTAIVANMQAVVSSAALYYDTNGESYGTPFSSISGTCKPFDIFPPDQSIFIDPKVQEAILASFALVGGTPGSAPHFFSCVVGQDGQSWALSMPLKKSPMTWWCVSSGGPGLELTTFSDLPGGPSAVAACI